jgi:uncharacterized protein (DUF111 family)
MPLRVGVGLGTRQLDRANLLRLTLARPLGDDGASEANEVSEVLLQQQAQIDDASAEDLAYLAEALRQGGAVEVFSQPVAMKKGRTGTLLTALMPPELGPALRRVWWCHGTTLGVREQLQNRWILPRHSATLATALGPVRIKWASLPDGRRRAKAEHADLVELAGRLGRSIEEVRDEVRRALASEQETP